MTPPVDDPAEPGKLLQEDSGGFWSHEHAEEKDHDDDQQGLKPWPFTGYDQSRHFAFTSTDTEHGGILRMLAAKG
ncbi:MAG: hypothetical protein WB679_25870 [Terracidiphilus sp.]